ncbi:MAG: GNAT family N-acetyltransferase [Candidatus Methanofastidiosa archaeon]|nr:GNAT family N-acetyltransferase [Candidatus Methanofastidiosa archaeon]
MKVLAGDEISRELWDNFISSNPFTTPFQTPRFDDFYNSVTNHSADVFAVDDEGSIVSLMVVTFQKEKGLKSFLSGRIIVYGGPVLKENTYTGISLITAEIKRKYKKKAVYIEIRNLKDYSNYFTEFESAGWKYIPYLNFRVLCSSESVIWSNLNRLRKRQIKRSIANNVHIGVAKGITEVKELYNLLYELYTNKIGKPIFSENFFTGLFKSGLCKVFIVKAGNKIIGGHICLYDENVIYDWYGCGLDKEYRDYAPSTMAVYAALLDGAFYNLKYFDFMGAGTPGEKYGVRDFKEQFGGEKVEYGRYRIILRPALFYLGKFGIKLLSKLKD